MLEGITINLIASCLVRGTDIGIDNVRGLIQRKRYSEDVDVLTTEFTSALKATIEPALTEHAQEDISVGEMSWTLIAKELDGNPMGFEDEQEAIGQITDAIGKGLDINLDTNPTLQDAVKAAVADAYQTTIRAFADRVAGTDRAEVFNTQANIELTAAVTTLDERLTALQRRLSRHDIAALRNSGFIRLDPLYFERHEPGDPETAWRIGFDCAEVKADYSLPRERPATTTNERQSITDEVFERLDAGENLVVLGEGGSGKSTVCKQVACQWCGDTNRGAVLYQERTTTASFDEPGTLIDAVRAAEDELLIVAEDASSGNATAIYEVLDEFEHASDVAFLLDARTSEWRDADDVMNEASHEHQRQQLSIVEMPALDERECQRAIDHYETLTGNEISTSDEQLYEEVRSADIGGPLVLAYRLTGPTIDSEQPISALHADVRQAYTAIEAWADGEDLPQTVAVMVNILNAAELPVEDAFLHALADNRANHRTIDRMVGFLEGTMLEQVAGDIRTPHPLWSALYLERMCEVAGERVARDRFERCVDALFRLIDDEGYREQVRHWVHDPSDEFTFIIDTPDQAAGLFVHQISEIGTTRPVLGILYGTPETWRVPLPEPCPVTAEVQWFDTRGHIHINRGSFDAAQAEFERLKELTESTTEGKKDESKQRQALVFDNLGTIARKRGDLTAANEFHKRSLTIAREINDRDGETRSLVELGMVTHARGDLETADEYLGEALTITQGRDNHQAESVSLTNLGLVAGKRGDLEAAEKYHKEALAINREMGDRQAESVSLTNLGNVAKDRGDLEAAEKYHKEALAINREMGDRHGEARTLVNLGIVAFDHEDLETAEEYFKQGLDLFQKVGARQGEARSLTNLGNIAGKRNDLEAAKEYYEESLAIKREMGDRYGEAQTLGNLGIVAKNRGELEAAEEYYKEALVINREIGACLGEARNLGNFGIIAAKRNDLEDAKEYHEEALAIKREMDDRYGEAQTLGNLGNVAKERGKLEAAEKYFKQSLDLFQETGTRQDIVQNLDNIGVIAIERGNLEAAEEYYKKALPLNREIGARQDEAENLGNLGVIAYKRDDLEAAKEYFKQGLDFFQEIDARQEIAQCLTNLGNVANERGDWEAAKEYYEERLAIDREADNRDSEAHTLSGLGQIAQERENLGIAKEHFEEAIEIFRDIDNISCRYHVFNNLIDVYEQRGAVKNAIEWCERAIELADGAEDDTECEHFQKRRSELDET